MLNFYSVKHIGGEENLLFFVFISVHTWLLLYGMSL